MQIRLNSFPVHFFDSVQINIDKEILKITAVVAVVALGIFALYLLYKYMKPKPLSSNNKTPEINDPSKVEVKTQQVKKVRFNIEGDTGESPSLSQMPVVQQVQAPQADETKKDPKADLPAPSEDNQAKDDKKDLVAATLNVEQNDPKARIIDIETSPDRPAMGQAKAKELNEPPVIIPGQTVLPQPSETMQTTPQRQPIRLKDGGITPSPDQKPRHLKVVVPTDSPVTTPRSTRRGLPSRSFMEARDNLARNFTFKGLGGSPPTEGRRLGQAAAPAAAPLEHVKRPRMSTMRKSMTPGRFQRQTDSPSSA